MRELNNTDFLTNNGMIEGWVTNSSSDGKTGINVGESSITTTPTGLPVVQAMRGTRMSASVGFRGKTNQIFLFYQLNGTDVRLVTRDEQNVSGWGQSVALDVGIF